MITFVEECLVYVFSIFQLFFQKSTKTREIHFHTKELNKSWDVRRICRLVGNWVII